MDEADAAPESPHDVIRRLMDLVDLDYERTTAFIVNVVGAGAAIRGWAVALWLGLLGFAFDREMWQLAALAFLVTAVFWLVDGYHATLYGHALEHARATEDLTAKYFTALNREDDDPESIEDLRVRLAGHRFGLYANLWTFHVRDVWFARPAVFFRLTYPALLTVAMASALLAEMQ